MRNKDIVYFDARDEEPTIRRRYSRQLVLQARMYYEINGMGPSEIAKRLGISTGDRVSQWASRNKWRKGCLSHIAEGITAQESLKVAQHLGLGQVDQMLKAKELMEATFKKTIKAPDGDAEIDTEEPDYKTQNEGLKRAMELTGTKIERTEHEHRHMGDIVHRYALPERKQIGPSPT